MEGHIGSNTAKNTCSYRIAEEPTSFDTYAGNIGLANQTSKGEMDLQPIERAKSLPNLVQGFGDLFLENCGNVVDPRISRPRTLNNRGPGRRWIIIVPITRLLPPPAVISRLVRIVLPLKFDEPAER